MKTSIKKHFRVNHFKDIIEKSNFVGFFYISNLNIPFKLDLKKKLQTYGLQFEIIQNKLFQKALLSSSVKYNGVDSLVQGFVIIIFPINLSNDNNYYNLKLAFEFLKTYKNVLFIGGISYDNIVNKLFSTYILSIQDTKEVFYKLLSTINNPGSILVKKTKKTSNNLNYILGLKKY